MCVEQHYGGGGDKSKYGGGEGRVNVLNKMLVGDVEREDLEG